MAKSTEGKLIGFNFIFSISLGPVLQTALLNFKAIHGGVLPYFLISLEKLIKGDAGEIQYQKLRLAIGVEDCERYQIWDSVGYSIGNLAIIATDVEPEQVASFYHSYPCALGVGADAPFRNVSFQELFCVNMDREAQFDEAFQTPAGMLLYKPIHGEIIVRSEKTGKLEYSLSQRIAWAEAMGRRGDGWAMRIGFGEGPAVDCYFALFAWSRGIDSLHLLGAGGVSMLCLFVFMEHMGVYRRLSMDATSYTIMVLQYGMYYRIKDQRLSSVSLKEMLDPQNGEKISAKIADEMANCQSFDGGPCETCAFMQAKFGKTFPELFWEYREMEASDTSDRLLIQQWEEWLVAHSMASAEYFIKGMRSKVNDRDEYFSLLEKIEEIAVVEAIKNVMLPVIESGRDAYAANIKLLGQTKAEKKFSNQNEGSQIPTSA